MSSFAGDANWLDVPLWGGGQCNQIDITDAILITNDTQGCFVWSVSQACWQPLITASTLPSNLLGSTVWCGICCVKAPGATSPVYYCDAYTGQMLIAPSVGGNWSQAGHSYTPIGVSTGWQEVNESWNGSGWEGYGPRAAVDHSSPNHFFLWLSSYGLWTTFDAGVTWYQATPGSGTGQLPTSTPVGSSSQYFPATVVCPDGTGDVYVTIYAPTGPQLYKNLGINSSNYATNWTPVAVSGGPAAGGWFTCAHKGNGCIYYVVHTTQPGQTTGNAQVWQFNTASHIDQWTQLYTTPKTTWAPQQVAYCPINNILSIADAGGNVELSIGSVWTSRLTLAPTVIGDTEWLYLYSKPGVPPGDHDLVANQMAFDADGRLHMVGGSGHWISNYTNPLPCSSFPSLPLVAGNTVIGWQCQTKGIKNLSTTGIVTYPGANPFVTVDDFNAFELTSLTQQPSGQVYNPVYSAANGPNFVPCQQMDWSKSGSPLLFMLSEPSYLNVGVSATGYSTSLGAPGSWTILSSAEKPTGFVNAGTVSISTEDNWVWLIPQKASTTSHPVITLGPPVYTLAGRSSTPNWTAGTFYHNGIAISNTDPVWTNVAAYGIASGSGSINLGPNGLLAADGATALKHYFYMPNTYNDVTAIGNFIGLYVSTDGGATFNCNTPGGPGSNGFPYDSAQGSKLINQYIKPKIKCPLGVAGHVWFSCGDNPYTQGPNYSDGGYLVDGGTTATGPSAVYPSIRNMMFLQSSDSGVTWQWKQNVWQVIDFGFGQQAPWGTYPTLFIIGWVQYPSTDWVYGVHVSYDAGNHWVQLGKYPKDYCNRITHITGDWNGASYNRCYIAVGGQSFLYHP